MSDKKDAPAEHRPLVISVAGSVRSKGKLERRERTWQQLVDLHFTKATRWTGTRDEFMALPKTQKDRIKDIGYFVGGEFKDERRLGEDLVGRDLLTLDADFADPDILDQLRRKLACEWLVYSTIKHHPAKPRLRLVIPLARTLTPEEYEPVARKVAEAIGIDQFDDTTYQGHRAMFWPMHCRDVEPVCEQGEGPWLNPDNMLARYLDWQNTVEWPKSSRQDKVLARKKQKAGDPLDKPGIVGAFCRAFPIADAIAEFLPEVYTLEGDERFTYKKGSTANGAVVYEDKWLYSWHGTDPATGQLCNAFDLVRLHRFLTLDSDTDEGTPVNKLPSYMAMCDLARGHAAVKKQAMADQLAQAGLEFDEIEPSEPGAPGKPEPLEWAALLDRDRKNNILGTAHNVAVLLLHAPGVAGRVWYNRMSQHVEVTGDLPWRRSGKAWRDVDDYELQAWLNRTFDMDAKITQVQAGVVMMETRNSRDPLTDYLDGLVWDGVPRLDTLLIDYLGAEDTELTRAMTRKWAAQAVARAYQPGVKADHMLLLSGEGGIGKSRLANILAKQDAWFGEHPPSMKDAHRLQEWMQGRWLVEMGELTSMAKAEIESVKAFLSQRLDRFRAAYGHYVQDSPRRCVFLGTTNEATPLKDATGNRRFWLVYCPRVMTAADQQQLEADVDQIWAEAKAWWQLGEALWLDTPELQQAFDSLERVGIDDPWGIAEIIQEYIDEPVPKGYYDAEPGAEFGDETEARWFLLPSEIRQLIDAKVPGYRGHQNRDIAAAVRKIGGWVRVANPVRTGLRYGQKRVFVKESEMRRLEGRKL